MAYFFSRHFSAAYLPSSRIIYTSHQKTDTGCCKSQQVGKFIAETCRVKMYSNALSYLCIAVSDGCIVNGTVVIGFLPRTYRYWLRSLQLTLTMVFWLGKADRPMCSFPEHTDTGWGVYSWPWQWFFFGYGKPTVLCMCPITYVFQLKILWAEVQLCFVRVR
jgi:hypothetical protein